MVTNIFAALRGAAHWFCVALVLGAGAAMAADPSAAQTGQRANGARDLPAATSRLSTKAETKVTDPTGAPRVLMMGDSMLFTNRGSGRSVGRQLEKLIGTRITDKSWLGTRYAPGPQGATGAIPRQYVPGRWDVVVLNGGGNDLMFGCGCRGCGPMLDALISADGTRGAIPALVARIRQGGARVVYSGYLRSPGVGSVIEACRDEGDVLERRLAKMAARDTGVTFVSMADLVPDGDRSYHQDDMIHPSPKGSRAIAERLAMVVRH